MHDIHSKYRRIWSPPIPLHWLWLMMDQNMVNHMSDEERKQKYIASVAAKSCIHWFEEDGKQTNFIRVNLSYY